MKSLYTFSLRVIVFFFINFSKKKIVWQEFYWVVLSRFLIWSVYSVSFMQIQWHWLILSVNQSQNPFCLRPSFQVGCARARKILLLTLLHCLKICYELKISFTLQKLTPYSSAFTVWESGWCWWQRYWPNQILFSIPKWSVFRKRENGKQKYTTKYHWEKF